MLNKVTHIHDRMCTSNVSQQCRSEERRIVINLCTVTE